MPGYAEVQHTQWIEAPLATVQAQFADLDHHIRSNVHPDLHFEILARHANGARFVQEVRLLGIRQRDVFERRIQADGRIEDRSVEGFNSGGSLSVRFTRARVEARSGTQVEITIRLPLPPLIGPLVKPLLEAQIRKAVRTSALQDREDIEQRGYPRQSAALPLAA